MSEMQATLDADQFTTPAPSDTDQTDSTSSGDPDERPATGTAAFADVLETPVGRSDPGATRSALLGAAFGTTVVVAGRGYTVGRHHQENLRVVLSAPMVRFLETDTPFYVLEDTIVPQDAVPDDGQVPDDAMIPLAAVAVQDTQDRPLAAAVESTPARVTTERACPDCDESTTAFHEDTVEVSSRNTAQELPSEAVVSVRYCHECEATFLRARDLDAATETAVIERTRGLYGVDDDPIAITGLYTATESCLMRMMKDTNAYDGLWTASEVAAFVNTKLDDTGPDGELFGFVSVHDDGRIVWHDDQPYSYEVEFKPVPDDLNQHADAPASAADAD